jgi:hypothetical protein
VRLATADRPDVVCLQELPVWSLSLLEAGATCRRSARLRHGTARSANDRVLTDLNHGLLRSAVTGQAGVLLARGTRPRPELDRAQPRGFPRAHAQALGLDTAPASRGRRAASARPSGSTPATTS